MRPFMIIAGLLLTLMLSGSAVPAECDPGDNNNDETTAVTIGPDETVAGVVCPDDPFDYYTIVIPDSATVTGTVSFSSTQDATVLRVYNKTTSKTIIDDLSTTTRKSYSMEFEAGKITPGTYYCRIYHWSDAAYDHEYTLTLDLHISLPASLGTGGWTPSDLQVVPGPPSSIMLSTAPWPDENGNADHCRRSFHSGPGGNMAERESIDLFNEELSFKFVSGGWYATEYFRILEESMREESFSNLRVGPGNIMYFLGFFEEIDSSFTFIYKTDSGQQAYKEGLYKAILGFTGSVYAIDYKLQSLISVDKLGELTWYEEIPEFGYKSKVMGVGQKVYVDNGYETPYYNNDNAYLTAFSFNGDINWTVGPLPTELVGTAEDSAGNLFVRCTGEELYKISPGGSIEGMTTMPAHDYTVDTTDEKLGPIVGTDGRVWTSTRLWMPPSEKEKLSKLPVLESAGMKKAFRDGPAYCVVDTDGSIYKNGMYGPSDKQPVYACYGSNGILCVGFRNNTITAYKDWDQIKWSGKPEVMGTLLDMIMDSENRLYVLYTAGGVITFGETCHISVLDSMTGENLGIIQVDVPSEWQKSPSELAIGENNTLIYLNAAGFLRVYGRAMQLDSGFSGGPTIVR